MKNLEFKSLKNNSVETIHQAFIDAFSDYEVQIQMPLDKFVEMMKTRDLNPEYSIGCFDGKKLVGFIVCGYREIDNKKVCYDGGTGVIKEYRRLGIGETLLKNLLVFLQEKKIDLFVLEVLENNTPAINLYEKSGFRKTRRLECFEINKDLINIKFRIELSFASDYSLLNGLELNNYLPYIPTWQNHLKSIENVKDNYIFRAIQNEKQVVCFGFIHKSKGDIPHVGILNEWKNKGLESELISELALQTKSEKIIVLNVEENNYFGEILRKAGFKNSVNQFEMILEL